MAALMSGRVDENHPQPIVVNHEIQLSTPTLYFVLFCFVSHAQQPLVSLVGSYQRDNPKDDPTNYQDMYAPCFKEFVTSSVAFRGYDERQDWWGLGDAYYYLKFNSSGTCAADTLPVVGWLESVEAFVKTADGFTLADAAGSPVASLTIDGAPDPIPDAADFYAEPPEVTDDTRADFAATEPRPSSLTVGSLEGQWAAEGTDVSTGAGVEFAADGTWTGSDGCNGGSGRWAADASGGFLATSGVSTLMACEGASVPSWVAQARLAGFDGDVLVLLDRDGGELGRLVKG